MTPLNPEHLPHVTSSVERFLIDRDGNAGGMMLLNGVEVHFAPYLSSAVLTAIEVGDRITVYGELPLAEPMIVAAIIEATNGERIEDLGLPVSKASASNADRLNKQGERSRFPVKALTRHTLHGPTGESRGRCRTVLQ